MTATTAAPPPLPLLGHPWTIRFADPERDAGLVHDWMRAPHVERFWHQSWRPHRWRAELAAQLAGDHSRPCVVDLAERPIAYIEVYRVARDRLAAHYPHDPGDLGVHIAIGPVEETGRGTGRILLRAIAEGLLAADPACVRVVAEPDVGNEASGRAFAAAGFRSVSRIALPDKTADLYVYPRDDDAETLGKDRP